MVLLIDTAALPPRERNEALSALFSEASAPMQVTHDVPDELIRNRTHYWNLGAHNGLIRSRDNGVRFTRTARDVRADDRELFAMTVQHSGSSISREDDGTESVQTPGMLSLHHVASAHEFAFTGDAENASFLVSHEDLDLPMALVLGSSPLLRFSPLYSLVQADFAQLSTAAEDVSANAAASALLAGAMIPLVRALVASTDEDNRRARDAIHETLFDVVVAAARRQGTDRELDDESLARASGNSVRRVRALRSPGGLTVQEYLQ